MNKTQLIEQYNEQKSSKNTEMVTSLCPPSQIRKSTNSWTSAATYLRKSSSSVISRLENKYVHHSGPDAINQL